MKINNSRPVYRFTGKALHIDLPLLGLLFVLICIGLFILYSASNQNIGMVLRQSIRLLFALAIMVVFAFIPPHKYKLWTPWIYGVGLVLLIAVMLMGKIGKGYGNDAGLGEVCG